MREAAPRTKKKQLLGEDPLGVQRISGQIGCIINVSMLSTCNGERIEIGQSNVQ